MPTRTALDRRGEQPLQSLEVRHFAPDLVQMMNRDFANFIAARLFGAAQFKDGAHFARREAKLPRPLYKAQGPDMLVGKDPVAAFGSIGLGEQANFSK